MCEECGCHEKKIVVDKSIHKANDSIAHDIWHRLKDNNILCINLMGSPGSGKTSFIEGISEYLETEKLAVIQGDLESDVDKKRLEKVNIDTYQINTHSGCHLNADMIDSALKEMNLTDKKFLIIENVGNLVCPAGIKIGEHMNLLVSSVTEGSDKPKKYPHIFRSANLIIISKTDLSKAVEFDEKMFLEDIKKINSKAKIIKVSTKNKESFRDAVGSIVHKRKHLIEHNHKH